MSTTTATATAIAAQPIAAGSWRIDTIHSHVGFAVKHMVVSTFRTSFKKVDASLVADGDDIKLTGTVYADSIDIEQPDLKGHVLSGEFFDVENTPTIEFVSTSVRREADDSVTVEGDLTIKGTTKPVTATGKVTGPVTDFTGRDRAGVELSTVVDRTEFGLNWNAPLPKGGFAVENDVTIDVHLEFVREAA
jgi:polyisoprenoid-binding protein YceI